MVCFLFQCPWWSWECNRDLNRERDIALRLVVFWVSAIISGTLYALIIAKLRTTRRNPRKVALIRAFISLYALWILCFAPYDIFEVFYLSNRVLGNWLLPVTAPGAIKSQNNAGQFAFMGSRQRLILVEAVLSTLRFSYGFFNSLLLLALLKPFRDPPKNIHKFVVERINRACNTLLRFWRRR